MHMMQTGPGPRTTVDGKEYLYFCGTGYLGLQNDPRLLEAACEATRQFGLGTATSRSGYGTSSPVAEVERLAANYWGCESAFYFASGYMGNHVVLSALAESVDAVFLDAYAHYSIVDACRSFDLPVETFNHRDPQSLSEALSASLLPRQRPLVMSDGVFASSGALAPANDYLAVLAAYEGAALCLDDCHAFGVLGASGRGSFEHHGVDLDRINQTPDHDPATGVRLFAVGTLSKAFGAYGGIVCGSRVFIDLARRSSHYYSGASAPPTPVAAAAAAALQLIAENPERIARVQQNARRLKQGLKSLGLTTDDAPTPIAGLEIGNEQNMRRIQQAMAADGVLIAYSPEYSGIGPEGALRISVFATHSGEDLLQLLDCLSRRL
ncbi:8-amino-7-oxononanoate synthase 2 [Pseudobythopirellula maris]|uniref:8-amino-7-oxononanoate synthase 2 n=1 Tax=Pseudobythopirellula maris TaxID=2527991 RepID=A0A5C5ZS78_9BACT|nr:pyridoxal phosphate-dependent aminotransferase family protein [Pseudobythopirellula maris]TWT90392.1 8-amino-7-oxononanoate synthase 2 [Pseudobythopirellula maris]